jgi:integrase
MSAHSHDRLLLLEIKTPEQKRINPGRWTLTSRRPRISGGCVADRPRRRTSTKELLSPQVRWCWSTRRVVGGHQRQPPGYLAGRAPHNKGMQYPPDPPRPEEIIVVTRLAGHDRHRLRLRALIAVLSHAGLRISEARALNETDIDTRPRVAAIPSRQGRQPPRAEACSDGRGSRLFTGSRGAEWAGFARALFDEGV